MSLRAGAYATAWERPREDRYARPPVRSRHGSHLHPHGKERRVSDVPNDPLAGVGAGEQEPSEEEIRAYLGQLRAAPVGQVLAEVSSALVNAAQVKLGRQDARVLLDAVGALNDATRGRVEDELTSQLDDVLSKLRMAQVEAEREVAAAASQGHDEPGDVPADGASEGAAASSADSAGTPSPDPGQGTGKRLWTPGG